MSLLRILELIKMLDLQLSYAAVIDITTHLFTVVQHNYLDMQQVGNIDELFATLRVYEQHHSQVSRSIRLLYLRFKVFPLPFILNWIDISCNTIEKSAI